MSYIAFLDLLGTKNLMLDDTDEYEKAVRNFNEILVSRGGEECHIYAFSDCAYFQNEKLEGLLNTLDSVRDGLMCQGRYFTAAVTRGKLGATIMNSLDGGELHGFSFSAGGISKAYILQSSMKGIGIQVDSEIYNQALEEEPVLQGRIKSNYYISDLGKSSILTTFYDLLMCPPDTISSENTISAYFSDILEQYIKANIKSPRYGRYYLSPIINLLNAIQFGEDDFDLSVDGLIRCKFDIVNFLLYESKRGEYLLENAVGFEYIYISFLNKIMDDFKNTPNKYIHSIIRQLFKKSVLNKYILNTSLIPDGLLRKKNYNMLLDEYYRIIVEDEL